MKPLDPARLASWRCTGPAWVIGWAFAIYLPSALIAFAGLSPLAAVPTDGLAELGRATFRVADEIGPVAKLLIGLLLALFWYGAARFAMAGKTTATAANTAAGVLAIIGVLLLVPPTLSRGFGIGLSGARLDPAILPFYIAGGIAAGLVFTLSLRRCARL